MIQGFGTSDVGNARDENEDSFLVDNALGLYIVCDGMGGEVAGKRASQIAVQSIKKTISELKPRLSLIESEEQLCRTMAEVVRNAVQAASDDILEQAEIDPSLKGMGSTVTMLFVQGVKACVGHVGDSRMYLYRDECLHQLTKDHTVVQDLIDTGVIKAEKAETSPYAHVLTRALGKAALVPCDTLVFEILPADRLLICSDGLSAHAEFHELETLIASSALAMLSQQLVSEARLRDGSDNITAVVVAADYAVAEQDRARGEEVRLQLDTLKQMYVFSDLTMQELLRVMDVVRIEDCSDGEELIREAEQGNSLYIILQGSFSVERHEQVITTLSRGNHFGEMSLLSNAPRSATVRAIADSRLLRIDRQDFIDLLVSESRIGVKLLWRLSGKLSQYLNNANIQIYGE